MADESFETVDSLELRINASAKDAADKIESLSTSVANFGAKVSSYIKDVSAFADAIGRISSALGNMSGLKNLKGIIGSVASTAGRMKDKTFQKQLAPIAPPVRASSTVGGQTRVVNWQGRGMRRFSQTSDDIAKEMNQRLNGSGMTNKNLSARISAVRDMIIKDDENAVAEVKKLADELAGGAGGKNVSSLIQALNDVVGNKTIGVKEADIKGFGENLGAVNAVLKDSGARFRFGKMVPRTSPKYASMVAPDDLESMGISSAEDLYKKILTDSYRFNGHSMELGRQGVNSDEQLSNALFGDLMDKLYGSEEVATKNAEAMKANIDEATDSVKEQAAVWEEVSSKIKEAGEAAKDLAINADSGAGPHLEQYHRSYEEFLQKRSEAEKDAAEEAIRNEATEVPYIGRHKSFEEYNGPDLREQNARATAEFEERFSQIVNQPDAAKNIRANIKKLREMGVGNSRAFFSQAKEQTPAEESSAEPIVAVTQAAKEASAAQEDLAQKTKVTADEFLQEASKADILQMKLDGVKAKLEEAVNADTYDPGKIARLTEQVQKLGSQLAEIRGTAAENVSPVAEVFDEVVNEVQQAEDAVDNFKEATSDIGSAAGAMEQVSEAAESIEDSAEHAASGFKEMEDAAEDVKKQSIGLGDVFRAIGKTLEKSVLGQLARVARMRALRGIVKGLASAFKEGIGNLYQWSKGVGGSFAGAMDTLASKTMLAKNSVATAFAPAIQALVPLISTVVSWINTASNAIAQFFALLNGQTTWTRATESVEEWAAATKKGAGGASSAVKDLLADWDELNIIQSESGGGGGGGGGSKAPDYKSMFEEVDMFDDWTKDFETIKDIVLAIGAGIAAWFVVDTIQDFLSKLGIAGEMVDSIFRKIKQVIVGAVLLKVAFELAEDVGADIAENGLTWENALKGIGALIAGGLGGYFVGNAIGIGGPIGTILGLTITAAIGLNAYIDKKRSLSYSGMAKAAFAAAGAGGFNVDKYKEHVEKELNKRMGTLSISIDAFETYGTAKTNLEAARKELDEMAQYINGSKALTKEDAERFKANWDIIYEAVAQMHDASWETINLGIADAMKAELEESEKYLRDLEQRLLEAARLAGGAQAEWQEEMRQINGRIVKGNATEEDFERYEVLTRLIGGSNISKSLETMNEWSKTIEGFDFGSGPEAIENAQKFMGDMGETYDNAIEEVRTWEATQNAAIEAAKDELETYNEMGFFDGKEEDYQKAVQALEEYSGIVEKTAKKNYATIAELQQDTYGRLFGQIIRGYVLDQENGGSGTQYFKEVEPLLKMLKEAGFTTPDVYDWLEPGDESILSKGKGFFDNLWDFLGGKDHLNNQQVEARFAAGTGYGNTVADWGSNPLAETAIVSDLSGDEVNVEAETVTLTGNVANDANDGYKPDGISADQIHISGKYIDEDNDDWSLAGGEAKAATVASKEAIDDEARMLVREEMERVRNLMDEAMSLKDENGYSSLLNQYEHLRRQYEGEEPISPEYMSIVADQVDLTGDYSDDESGEASLGDLTNGAVAGSSAGYAPWFSGPSEESFEMDASGSGLATDDKVGEVGTVVGAGFGQLESLMNAASTILRSIEAYSRITANKDFTVNVNASTGLGRVAARSAMKLAGVTGEP